MSILYNHTLHDPVFHKVPPALSQHLLLEANHLIPVTFKVYSERPPPSNTVGTTLLLKLPVVHSKVRIASMFAGMLEVTLLSLHPRQHSIALAVDSLGVMHPLHIHTYLYRAPFIHLAPPSSRCRSRAWHCKSGTCQLLTRTLAHQPGFIHPSIHPHR